MMIEDQPGVLNQMTWEQDAATHLGIQWDVRLYSAASTRLSGLPLLKSHIPACDASTGAFTRFAFWVKFRLAYYKWLCKQAENYDVILLRHGMYDPFRPIFIRKVRIPVFSVHHTLEVPEILGRNKGALSMLKAMAEWLLGKRALIEAKGIIGVTGEIAQYELRRAGKPQKPFYVYPNGIAFSEENVKTIVDKRSGNVPELLFIASSFLPWHGLDLILKGLASIDEEFVLHLVGKISDADKRVAADDCRVVLHGVRNSSEISELSARAWVGLSSFALERNGMKEACTLKVREYLSMGLPVYAGYRDVFPEWFFGYRKGPPDIHQILAYAKSCRVLEKRQIAMQSEPYISKARLLLGLKTWLDSVVGGSPAVSP